VKIVTFNINDINKRLSHLLGYWPPPRPDRAAPGGAPRRPRLASPLAFRRRRRHFGGNGAPV